MGESVLGPYSSMTMIHGTRHVRRKKRGCVEKYGNSSQNSELKCRRKEKKSTKQYTIKTEQPIRCAFYLVMGTHLS